MKDKMGKWNSLKLLRELFTLSGWSGWSEWDRCRSKGLVSSFRLMFEDFVARNRLPEPFP